MIPEDSLQPGDFRLLDVDNKLVVPADCHTRLIITSSDVLHSFAVPSLGVKLDACPGDGPNLTICWNILYKLL
jgi:cytochrome c oxidase subunit 2